MIAFGTIAGGAGAALTKGNFWQGAATGLVVSGLNHVMHDGDSNENGEGDPPSKTGVLKQIKENFFAVVDELTKAKEFVLDFAGGVGDFTDTYFEMREANWVNSDKYFHSKANFKASLRGPGGRYAAEKLSNLREITDQRIKGDSRASSVADQKANSYGRLQAQKLPYFRYQNLTYKNALPQYRPSNLPKKY